MSRRVTLQTVADAVGVSRTTVSNAYSRPDQLAPDLRRRILGVAADLGYAGPDPAARSLRRGRAGAVGLLFSEALGYAFTDPAVVLFLQGVAEAGEPASVGLLLLPAPPGAPEAPGVRDAVVDGFLVYSVPDGYPGLRAVLDRRLPTVTVDEPVAPGPGPAPGFVGIDDRAGARALAQHLLDLGHRRVGVVTDRMAPDDRRGRYDPGGHREAPSRVGRERLAGYADALTAAGVAWPGVPIVEEFPNTVAAGRAAASALLDVADPPTAILAITDQLALGVLVAARERGLRVPEDLSVTGFDDVPAAAHADPPLTTVRQPLVEKGRAAARLLLDLIAERPTRHVDLPADLVVRASTAPPRSP